MKTTKLIAKIAAGVLAGMMIMGIASCSKKSDKATSPVAGKTYSNGIGSYEFTDAKNVTIKGPAFFKMEEGDELKTTYKLGPKEGKITEILIEDPTYGGGESVDYNEEADTIENSNYEPKTFKKVN
ncbi:hypothetical protein [Treponema sp.]|uniref:hypothetical protein n=1 Tax=Treponema sp. TaxID=166 RepID=UPI00257AA46F|nr:hypothetical protein [Treponema sp.]MBE6354684.1 hypothetical protein [Treponema sp.]